MAFRIEEIFRDQTPNGIVNQRLVQAMMMIMERTKLEPKQKDELLNLLLLIGKKLVGTWKHLSQYCEIEDRLIAEAQNSEPIEKASVQRIVYSQDLLLEFDEFLVQMKSTLDYLVKFPTPILGRGRWNQHTFGEKGERVIKALNGNIPQEYRPHAKLIEEMVIKPHQEWLKVAITARDIINHCLEGGASFQTFVVVKTIKDGEEFILVPQFDEGNSIRQVMNDIWWNLFILVEEFIPGFLSMSMPKELVLARVPVDLNSVVSPWRVMTTEEFQRISAAYKTTKIY